MKYRNLFVITGGPGVGKTTLLNALNHRGYLTVPEEARKIIKDQLLKDGAGLPWKNKVLYAQLILNASIETYNQIISEGSGIYFFDRGILDTICYMKMENLPVTTELQNSFANLIYNQKVFLLPPWQEIYETDNERKQTWEEALYTFKQMRQTYIDYGYQIIEVPKSSVEQRCNFIIKNIEER